MRCVGTGELLATAHDVVLDELIAGKAIQKSPVSPPDYGRAYDRLCEAYKGIDEFRLKLLGLLPLASSGIFLLADKAERDPAVPLWAIGAFGFVSTLALFAYELHCVKKCDRLIHIGKHLEKHLNVEGQFLRRPAHLARAINEPFAASLIYPATLAAWIFLTFFGLYPGGTAALSLIVFCVFFVTSHVLIRSIAGNWHNCDEWQEFARNSR